MLFRAIWVPWHCSGTHAKIWRWFFGVWGGWGSFCVLGGGSFGGCGGLAPPPPQMTPPKRHPLFLGGCRWVGVAVRLVCCLWWSFMCTNKKFFQSSCFASLLPSPRWVLPASLLASLASFRFLSVWFALHCRAAVFGLVFWSVFPHRGNVFLQSKKVRWSFALILVFPFCIFLFAFVFGLVCSALQSCGFRTGFLVRVPTSWEWVLAKQEGSLKLCALLGFSFLHFFVCFRFLFWYGLLCTAQLRFFEALFWP